MFAKLVNTPLKIAIIAEIVSLSLTVAVIFIIDGRVDITRLIIPFVISGPLAYVTNSIVFKYQQKIEEKNTQLELLTQDLKKANQKLQKSNAELDSFAHTVAHDLKTPLTALSGAFAMLQNKDIPEEHRERFTQMVSRSAGKMEGIITDLLLLSTLREGDAVQIEPFDMSLILSGAKERLGMLLEQHDAEIVHPDSWPVVEGYAPWIEAVWTNYLSNAIKYGGDPPKIKLGATPLKDNIVKFWIQDNGAELTTEQQTQLFIPFERLSQTKIEGHGLGLSIVQRIIHRLNGEVGVESNANGNTFYFTLPQQGEENSRLSA